MTTTGVTIMSPISDSMSWANHPDRKCKGKPWSMFFPVQPTVPGFEGEEEEVPYPPPATKQLCDMCPVRAECLDWALRTDQESGIWGGMTRYQREQITRTQSRKSCPDCGKSDIVTERGHEICLPCGISWPIVDTGDDVW
jgi:WhiB family redox-sensing transcriptional regulator